MSQQFTIVLKTDGEYSVADMMVELESPAWDIISIAETKVDEETHKLEEEEDGA